MNQLLTIKTRDDGALPRGNSADGFDVVRFDTLAALTEFELDLLARNESAAPGAFDVGEVHEDILLAIARDESEALLVIEELDGTGWHDYSFLCLLLTYRVIRRAPTLLRRTTVS